MLCCRRPPPAVGVQYYRLHPPAEGSAILVLPMVRMQAVVSMVRVPFDMVTGLGANEL